MSLQVARNALWNVLGTLATFAVGVAAVPILLKVIGADRLGIFTLALGLVGFSGLLDLGLGRSLTQGVSSAIGSGRPRVAVAALIWSVLRALAIIGVLWLVALWFFAPVIVKHLFKLNGQLGVETVFGLRAVALSIPFTLVATITMGALEGLQEFRIVGTRKAILSIAQFGFPTLAALWRPDVGVVIAALALSRALSICLWLPPLRRTLPMSSGHKIEIQDIKQLLHFGGWLSVSNIVGPLMAYADRFYLASIFSPALVATYTVPFDAMSRVTSLPMTAVGALFPALSEVQARPESSASLLRIAVAALVAIMLPPLLIITIFAQPLLSLWLGKHFASSTLPVFQILIVGVFVNSGAHIPYALLQAHGRSDLTAKLHLAELPVFIGLLLCAVSTWGVIGAAVAWTLRVIIDSLLLYCTAAVFQPSLRKVMTQGVTVTTAGAVCLLVPVISKNFAIILSTALVVSIYCGMTLQRLYLRWHGNTLNKRNA